MGGPVRTTTPAGEEIVILSADDYDRLVEELEDSRDSAIAREAIARLEAGEETLSSDEVRALLDAPTPLAFWRTHRGLALEGVAATVGISPAELGEIEEGRRVGPSDLYVRLAQLLSIEPEDLVPGL